MTLQQQIQVHMNTSSINREKTDFSTSTSSTNEYTKDHIACYINIIYFKFCDAGVDDTCLLCLLLFFQILNAYLCFFQEVLPTRVVRRQDNTIHRIDRYPVKSVNKIKPRYPLDSDLSSGQCYPPFEQPGPVFSRIILNYLMKNIIYF